MLDVNCHRCDKPFAIDEYLLEFYFDCQLICPDCAKKEKEQAAIAASDLLNGEGLPSFS